LLLLGGDDDDDDRRFERGKKGSQAPVRAIDQSRPLRVTPSSLLLPLRLAFSSRLLLYWIVVVGSGGKKKKKKKRGESPSLRAAAAAACPFCLSQRRARLNRSRSLDEINQSIDRPLDASPARQSTLP
jgi:hypothetical protein